MKENQNIEWKSNWHNDYLKWICGFANADGGILYIGKDDDGRIVGISKAKHLLESLPSIIRDNLGIMCEVNLLLEKSLEYIEIITKSYSVPISLRGRYYYRSGSSKMELTGNELTEFLLKKAGKTWDDIIEEEALIEDIDEVSLNHFLSDATESGRMPEVTNLTSIEILNKLRVAKGDKLKRAAIILFGKDPNAFYPNIKVKIGRFGGDDVDLLFQDVVEGNLVELLYNVPEILNTKYLNKKIEYSGLQRIEKGEYPVAAIREMLLNAMVHRNYMGSTIQLRVYDNKLTLWNIGILPEGMKIESLKQTHNSIPRNPIIAEVCFKSGYIDTWGRGTLKIFTSCKKAELPEPTIEEKDGGILVTIYKTKINDIYLRSKGLTERQIEAVMYVVEYKKITNKDYRSLFKVSKATATRDLTELIKKYDLFMRIGLTGSGTEYKLKGS